MAIHLFQNERAAITCAILRSSPRPAMQTMLYHMFRCLITRVNAELLLQPLASRCYTCRSFTFCHPEPKRPSPAVNPQAFVKTAAWV
jgi:hypothetical protein